MANKIYTVQGKKYIRKKSEDCDGCIFNTDSLTCTKPNSDISEPSCATGTNLYIFKSAPKKRKSKNYNHGKAKKSLQN